MHSQSAIGEQYVALLPRNPSPPLKDGDVIPRSAHLGPARHQQSARRRQPWPEGDPARTTSKPPSTRPTSAVGGLGPEISRIVKGSTQLAIDARKNLDSLTTVIDQSKPVLDSQANSSDSIRAWASHLAAVTGQLQTQNTAVAGVLEKGGPAAGEGPPVDRAAAAHTADPAGQPGQLDQVAITYQASTRAATGAAAPRHRRGQATFVTNLNTKQDYAVASTSFNLNINLPPPVHDGFLPAQQMRCPPCSRTLRPRAAGDSTAASRRTRPFNVRGASNTPCLTIPGNEPRR